MTTTHSHSRAHPAREHTAIDGHRALIEEVALAIHARPELRFEERFAAATLASALARAGVTDVETGVGGLATALRARCGKPGGASIAIIAEYDALPEIGHACGHNLIAAGALGAFLGLAAIADELEGEVHFIGTPAEEGGGGKIIMLENGVFAGLGAAMMFHPFDRDLLGHGALASVWLEMSFKGVPSHAALAPWAGKSALTAVMDTFRLIDGQRVHFRDGTRVHGFIHDGGQAVNIIPEHASCEFSVRATTTPWLADVRAIVERCARAAALASDVQVEIKARRGYSDMKNDEALMTVFGESLSALGRTAMRDDVSVGMGSTDMGDLSHALPSIHPYLAICNAGETTCHQHAFAAHAASPAGLKTALVAAKAMASTARRYLADPELRAQVGVSTYP